MPNEREGNVHENNGDNNPNNEAVNAQGNGAENVQVVPDNPAQIEPEGVLPGEAGYVPPIPPDQQGAEENAEPNADAEAPANSYLHYVGELKKAGFESDTVSRMIACAILMQRDPRENCNKDAVQELAEKFEKQPAFSELMEDPKTEELLSAGNGLELIELLADKENERRAGLDKYARPEEYTYEDSLFLAAAKEQLQEAEGITPGAKGKDRKDRLFTEMMKQVEAAEQLTYKGKQLSGEETKKLIDAVKKYSDGGGGLKAAGKTQAMCILKRYMPADEFKSYCDRINTRRKHKIDPEDFSERRLYGQELSVTEMKKKCRLELQKEFTLENCAALAACSMAVPRHGVIDAEEYEKQKALLLEKGSAFRKAMQNEDVQKKVAEMVENGGKANQIIGEINQEAMDRLGKSAQWHFNRSRNALLNTRLNTYFSGEHLSNIMALNQLSLSAGMSDKLTNKSFAERAEAIRSDPVFKRMADRYASDPEYRRHLNGKLREDGTGECLAEEYGRVQRSMKRRPAEAAQEANRRRAAAQEVNRVQVGG